MIIVDEDMRLIVDPPSGWKYGFPRVWDKEKHPTLQHLLKSYNYPQKDFDLALRYSRIWEKE